MLSDLFIYSANIFANRFTNVPYVAGAFKSIGTSSIHPAEAALIAAGSAQWSNALKLPIYILSQALQSVSERSEIVHRKKSAATAAAKGSCARQRRHGALIGRTV